MSQTGRVQTPAARCLLCQQGQHMALDAYPGRCACWSCFCDEPLTTPAREPSYVCDGIERHPNPCRCDCGGCKHHCAAHQPPPMSGAGRVSSASTSGGTSSTAAQTGRASPPHDEATVALVRAVMDYIDGECRLLPDDDAIDEHAYGCDACAFDALLQALPSSLQRAAIRLTTPASSSSSRGDYEAKP